MSRGEQTKNSGNQPKLSVKDKAAKKKAKKASKDAANQPIPTSSGR